MFSRNLRTVITILAVLSFVLFPLMVSGAERSMDAEQNYASCFRIYNRAKSCAGSGTCISEDSEGNCYILTNYHVAGNNDCTVQNFSDGNLRGVMATNVWRAYDEKISLDVAILKVSKADAQNICPYYIPMWNSDEQIITNVDTPVMICSSPKAYWLRMIESRARIAQGSSNIESSPTFFGGQSGSSMLAKVDGKWYVVGLNTWRTKEEGNEDYGGLSQPISRIIKAMSGEVKEEIGCPLPSNAIPCPYEEAYDCGGKQVTVDGEIAWECAGPGLPDYEMQDWSIAGCDPCLKARTYWNPKIAQEGVKVTVHHGDGNERYVADSLGISNYPTYILYNEGSEVKRWVGYYAENEVDILNTIKKIKKDIADKNIEKELKEQKDFPPSQPELECDDEACRLFGNNNCQPQQQPKAQGNQSNSGKFEFFSIPKTDREKEVEPKQEPILPRLLPNIPKDEPKAQPKEDDNNRGGLFNWKDKLNDELQNQKDKLENELEGKIKGLMMTSFWMMFLACTLAIACFGTIKQIAKCLWWGIKKVFSWIHDKIASFFSNGIKSAVAQIKETIDKQEEKATTKKSKE